MLERLKGTEEGERMQSEMKWDKAFKQAQGEVVRMNIYIDAILSIHDHGDGGYVIQGWHMTFMT